MEVAERTGRPGWAGKPLRQLSVGELTEALVYLEECEPADDALSRALAAQLAERTAAVC
ncbi:hypothetical protein SAMN04489712_102540 [Thermomonospora echinospora]|uniref:Uncharacterized protein n=1 Tax=Thermomonospora echinospora TaxID=1992 RepID=A0A1H5W244_9ACTN|nr:hypothetical protein [Thermomonospora echinospora]SEF92877.1 hypothetical protein SAMN04489712_102540 [Thermomonospora echinospora]